MYIFKKMFVLMLFVVFSVMVLAQILLKNSFVKTKISKLYKMESQYVYSEQEIKKGYITLEISNPSNELYLMENGEKVCQITSKKLQLDIADNTVIEIDGRNCSTQTTIKIAEISENVDGFFETDISVNSNIVILGRFFIK